MKVIGYTVYAFTPKPNGEEFTGYNFYTVSEVPQSKGSGLLTGKFSLSSQKLQELEITPNQLLGKEVELFFNQWGKVNAVSVKK